MQQLPKETKDKTANLNGDNIKLAKPAQRPDQTKDLPKVDPGHLVDLNLGKPKDDGNVLDLPGLAAVGLPSSGQDDDKNKNKGGPSNIRLAPHHDQHDQQEHHPTHDPLEGATIRVGKMACIEVWIIFGLTVLC